MSKCFFLLANNDKAMWVRFRRAMLVKSNIFSPLNFCASAFKGAKTPPKNLMLEAITGRIRGRHGVGACSLARRLRSGDQPHRIQRISGKP